MMHCGVQYRGYDSYYAVREQVGVGVIFTATESS